MITIILAVLLTIVWGLGAIFVTVITGWDMANLYDLMKIIFWPITVFIFRKN